MAYKSRKPIELSSINEERSSRGSVFDRLGAKQTMSQNPQSYFDTQIRSSSNNSRIQSSKYDNYPTHDNRTKFDTSLHSSNQSRHYNSANQYVSQSDSNPSNHQSDVYYSQRQKQTIKSKISKPDDYGYHDQYKKNYNEQGAEVLEKKRVEIKRELQKIDQQDKQQSLSTAKHHNRVCKSPCSSHSACSSSGSDSDSDSYSGSSSGSCSSSSCSSSSFSEDEERTTSHKNYKKNVSTMSLQPNTKRDLNKSYPIIEKTRSIVHSISSPPSNTNQQSIKTNKRYSDQMNLPTKRIRSRSPQSTASSYYSKKSYAGPLTPPLPTSSHHSLSNQSNSNILSSSINKQSIGDVKLDRHGNVRVSLKEKERQRMTKTSSPSYSSPHNISMNSYSKSSRSPLDIQSREDLYSSFGSVDDRKKFTPSPVNYHPQMRKSNYSNYEDRRSPSSLSFYYNKQTGSNSSSLRTNPNISDSHQYHRSSPSFSSTSVDHSHMLGSPRTPPPLSSHHHMMINKPKIYQNYQHNISANETKMKEKKM